MEKTSPSERPSWNCFLDRATLFNHVYCNVGLVFLFLLIWYVCQCHPTGSARGRARVRFLFCDLVRFKRKSAETERLGLRFKLMKGDDLAGGKLSWKVQDSC
jgi:hypothetical protein